MKASVAQIKSGVLSYIDGELIGKAPGLAQWALIATVAMFAQRAEEAMSQLIQNPVVRSLHIVDDNGLIDVDVLKSSLEEAYAKTGAVVQPIPFLGPVTFSKDDIQSLYEHIARA